MAIPLFTKVPQTSPLSADAHDKAAIDARDRVAAGC